MQLTCEFSDDTLPIGTKVFIPRAVIKDVHEDEIKGYYCTLFQQDGKMMLVPTDYRLGLINLSRGLDDGWKRDEFFLSYEEAKAAAVEYQIEATDEEWFKAIGLDNNEHSDRLDYDEECELGPCCAIISGIRNILYQACETGKMDGVTRTALISQLNAHEPPSELTPNLDKILAQLHIVWSDKQEPYVTLTK
jgi:hypothetical protein